MMRLLPEYLPKGKGERARLIPVVADTSREQRATSALLASIEMVDEFGRAVLAYVGAPVRKTSRIETFTEVTFENNNRPVDLRPDGLISISTGQRTWVALVEAKIGNTKLDDTQVDAYVDLAREIRANAIITISNQFTSRSYHHPVQINRTRLRTLELHHWSWGYLLSEAVLFVDHRGVSDPDQARVLWELTRFLKHQASGVIEATYMPTSWKDICAAARQEAGLKKGTIGLSECVEKWHELVRSIALQLSMDVGRNIDVYLSRSHENDPKARLAHDINELTSHYKLTAALTVPDAAGRLNVVADLARRTLAVSMDVPAPQDRTRPSASITWLRRQLDKADTAHLLVSAKWPGHTPDTMAPWQDIAANPEGLIDGIKGKVPRMFELRVVAELGGRFRGARTFVEDASHLIPDFYAKIGQHVQGWVPPPPRVKRVEDEPDEESTEHDELSNAPAENTPFQQI